MVSPNCKRFIITSLEGNEPFTTDNADLMEEFQPSESHYIIDTLTGTFWTGEEWTTLGERK